MQTIRPGDSGLAVSDVQKKLFDLGYTPPGFDAEMKEARFGESTARAVRAFQEERGLRAEGEVDETTWQELVEASFRLGDRFLYLRVPPFRGDDVREVQRYLNRLGFNAGREDGIFGRDTDLALRAFQHNMALPVDGIAGSSTISCLQRLKHAMKDTSVAEVHEALQDLATPRGLEGKSVVLDAAEGDAGAEEMLRLVPNELREASYALGVPKWLTILKIVIPTSIAGITTGVTLAIARVIGETAPLLIISGFTASMNYDLFSDRMMSLPVFVYTQYANPGSVVQPYLDRAWAGALTLILIVMALNLIARLIARIFSPKLGR